MANISGLIIAEIYVQKTIFAAEHACYATYKEIKLNFLCDTEV
jgi:hypothetical protein